jgi:hypothetical protein
MSSPLLGFDGDSDQERKMYRESVLVREKTGSSLAGKHWRKAGERGHATTEHRQEVNPLLGGWSG